MLCRVDGNVIVVVVTINFDGKDSCACLFLEIMEKFGYVLLEPFLTRAKRFTIHIYSPIQAHQGTITLT